MANTNNSYNGNNQQRRNGPIRFEILEHIAVLANKDNGWTKEVNIVAWNGGVGKVDLREWDPNHVRMSKGITLLDDEAELLLMALEDRYNSGNGVGNETQASADTGVHPATDPQPSQVAQTSQSSPLWLNLRENTHCSARLKGLPLPKSRVFTRVASPSYDRNLKM